MSEQSGSPPGSPLTSPPDSPNISQFESPTNSQPDSPSISPPDSPNISSSESQSNSAQSIASDDSIRDDPLLIWPMVWGNEESDWTPESPLPVAPYDVFDPFKHLPLELRLKIWRLTFPARTITRTMLEELSCIATVLPITACINQESRKETIKCYQKVQFVRPDIVSYDQPLPIFIGPCDMFRIEIFELLGTEKMEEFWKYALETTLPLFLGSFTKLEIQCWPSDFLNKKGEFVDPFKTNFKENTTIEMLKKVKSVDTVVWVEHGFKRRFPGVVIDDVIERVIEEAQDYLSKAFHDLSLIDSGRTKPKLTMEWR